ncbi:MAG: hypothetical protein AAF492_18155, partial [Verrucomicrobiota bacterium]
RVSVEVNGVPVPGAQTKTHYIRSVSGHNESSGSLVFYLNGLDAGSVLRVNVERDHQGGTVNDNDDALIFLWQKARTDRILTAGVTNVTPTSAEISAEVNTEGAIYDVTLFWGLTDGGTSPFGWSNSVSFGWFTNLTSTGLTHTLTNLVSGQQYVFSWRATNCANTFWTDTPRDFITAIGPLIDNGSGATAGVSVATLNGNLIQGEPADVRIYWGDNDGGTTIGSWDNTVNFGSLANGGFSTQLTGLLYGVQYYYRSFATNSQGSAWATSTVSFLTLEPPGIVLTNEPATSISSNSAILNASFSATGAEYTVWVYWGPTNQGTNAAAWSNAMTVGTFTDFSGSLTNPVSGLSSNTEYFFTWRATNAASDIWGMPVESFFTDTPSLVDNGTGAVVGAGSAVLNGTVVTGNNAHVIIYWGDNDGGTSAGAWDNAVALGSQPNGPVSTSINGLLFGVQYYYRVFASNTLGAVWANSTTNFKSIDPGRNAMKISFCGYDRPETLIDFPVLVQLSTNIPGFSYQNLVSTNGYDLRFLNSNRTVELNYEIEFWNTGGVSLVWVQ